VVEVLKKIIGHYFRLFVSNLRTEYRIKGTSNDRCVEQVGRRSGLSRRQRRRLLSALSCVSECLTVDAVVRAIKPLITIILVLFYAIGKYRTERHTNFLALFGFELWLSMVVSE